MKRIIAAISCALIIGVVWTASALACQTVGGPSVSAPNGQSGQSSNGRGTFRCLPDTKGTQKAANPSTPSPAVNQECINGGV